MSNLQKLLAVGLSVGLLVLLGFAVINKQSGTSTKNTIGLAYSLADTNRLSVTFNGKAVSPDQHSLGYVLAPGEYTAVISKPGFTPITTRFSFLAGQSMVLNADLQLASDSTLVSAAQLSSPGVDLSSAQITAARYFYSKTWVVANVQTPDGNSAVIVAAYDASSKVWITRLGPGTTFSSASIQAMPQLVQSYLRDHSYVSDAEVQQ
ncbi:MAG TPA: hypothetical protein VLF91_01845 [Candidatus Saccharimonadales bacterium]|nr:hypothetical protein [Candidatus Saccharimonadales bacterium]